MFTSKRLMRWLGYVKESEVRGKNERLNLIIGDYKGRFGKFPKHRNYLAHKLGSNVKFTAVLAGYDKHTGYHLLRYLKDMKNVRITDHIWVSLDAAVDYVNGEIVNVEGKVIKYYKPSKKSLEAVTINVISCEYKYMKAV